MLEEELLDLPGTAGGGASAIFVNGEAIAIAGGGGGLFAGDAKVAKTANTRLDIYSSNRD